MVLACSSVTVLTVNTILTQTVQNNLSDEEQFTKQMKRCINRNGSVG